ncbi:hypothetical protein KP509_1Z053800 [Ceratopteris richardii]|nr:hypothetical protein KP509_1Z053800 [Ceratopteris richardii]
MSIVGTALACISSWQSVSMIMTFVNLSTLTSDQHELNSTSAMTDLVANYLSWFLQSPTSQHVLYLKHLLRYLKRTQHFALTYHANTIPTPLRLPRYINAYWGMGGVDHTTQQSTSSFVFMLASTAISWQSKKQDHVSLSFTKEEYVYMTIALKEGVWLKTLIEETNLFPLQPLKLDCDNLSAILLAKKLKHSGKTKPIALKLQFICKLVLEGRSELIHVHTQYEWADFSIKSLPRTKHWECCTNTGLNT